MEDLLTGNREKNRINGNYWITFIFNSLAQDYLPSAHFGLKRPTPITNLASLIRCATI